MPPSITQVVNDDRSHCHWVPWLSILHGTMALDSVADIAMSILYQNGLPADFFQFLKVGLRQHFQALGSREASCAATWCSQEQDQALKMEDSQNLEMGFSKNTVNHINKRNLSTSPC